MIALPSYMLLSKIATPNKAGTLKGVSPISSCRNVMVKVKDTASFIEAARAVHGDKYDYSSTDYIGANMPIRIICKKHGLFTLGWAASHYSKKGSGCQKCSGCEAKVKDTFTFIEASKQIHGDKYDYSQTHYKSTREQITVICKTHGPFTLAHAGSHYSSTHRAGCKQCTTELRKTGVIGVPLKIKKCKCGFIGHGKDFPQHAKGDCINCLNARQEARREKNSKLMQRKCPVCGKAINSKDDRKVTCSVECGIERLRKDRIEVFCCVCSKSIFKRPSGVRENNCCSLRCQREWSLVKNHSTASENAKDRIDWLSRSKQAKSQWIRRRQKERLQKSSYGAWLRKASQQRSIFYIKEELPWKRRCASARSMLANRLEPAVKKEKASVITDWVKACDLSHRRFLKKVSKSKASPWMKKITVVEGSLRKRRQLRNAKQSC